MVFTTNYYPPVGVFCRSKASDFALCDGFVHQANAAGRVWDRASLDQLDPQAQSRRPLVLFKLHGSANWIRVKPAPSLIEAASRQKTRRTDTVTKSDAPIYAPDDPQYQNLLIYPAKQRVATNEPYFTAYDYLQRTLENTNVCIVVGYSFRDMNSLARLRSATRYNPELRLLVIDPNAKALCSSLAADGVAAEPVPVPFGVDAADAWLRPIRSALAAAVPRGFSR